MADEIGLLKNSDGKTIKDLIAVKIAKIGENIVLRRGTTFSVPEGVLLSGLTHPSASIHSTDVQYGRYGTLMAFTQQENGTLPEGQTQASMARQFCQHIIGMNPVRVGNQELAEGEQKNSDEDLIHQDFLMDQDFTVAEMMLQTGISVKDFLRYEVGQKLD